MGGILLKWVKFNEFHHSGSKSTRTASEPCKKAYELLLFSASGAEGCFLMKLTLISHFSINHDFHKFSWNFMKMMEFIIFVAKSGPLRSRGRRTYYIQADSQVSACPFGINHGIPLWNCEIPFFYDFMVNSWKSLDFMKIHENDWN